MKVLAINGSARENGNTAIILRTVLEELQKCSVETELVQLAGSVIYPCRGCFACKGRRNCVFQNDRFAEIFEKMKQADGLLLGSPVYSADISAGMKALLERSGVIASTNPGIFRHKIGASVAAVRRGGGLTAVDTMHHFMLNKEMIVVGSTYWNMVYGKNTGDVLSDEEGMKNMRNLGQNMAWLLQKLTGESLS